MARIPTAGVSRRTNPFVPASVPRALNPDLATAQAAERVSKLGDAITENALNSLAKERDQEDTFDLSEQSKIFDQEASIIVQEERNAAERDRRPINDVNVTDRINALIDSAQGRNDATTNAMRTVMNRKAGGIFAKVSARAVGERRQFKKIRINDAVNDSIENISTDKTYDRERLSKDRDALSKMILDEDLFSKDKAGDEARADFARTKFAVLDDTFITTVISRANKDDKKSIAELKLLIDEMNEGRWTKNIADPKRVLSLKRTAEVRFGQVTKALVATTRKQIGDILKLKRMDILRGGSGEDFKITPEQIIDGQLTKEEVEQSIFHTELAHEVYSSTIGTNEMSNTELLARRKALSDNIDKELQKAKKSKSVKGVARARAVADAIINGVDIGDPSVPKNGYANIMKRRLADGSVAWAAENPDADKAYANRIAEVVQGAEDDADKAAKVNAIRAERNADIRAASIGLYGKTKDQVDLVPKTTMTAIMATLNTVTTDSRKKWAFLVGELQKYGTPQDTKSWRQQALRNEIDPMWEAAIRMRIDKNQSGVNMILNAMEFIRSPEVELDDVLATKKIGGTKISLTQETTGVNDIVSRVTKDLVLANTGRSGVGEVQRGTVLFLTKYLLASSPNARKDGIKDTAQRVMETLFPKSDYVEIDNVEGKTMITEKFLEDKNLSKAEFMDYITFMSKNPTALGFLPDIPFTNDSKHMRSDAMKPARQKRIQDLLSGPHKRLTWDAGVDELRIQIVGSRLERGVDFGELKDQDGNFLSIKFDADTLAAWKSIQASKEFSSERGRTEQERKKQKAARKKAGVGDPPVDPDDPLSFEGAVP